jgi:hypothetical protein
LTNGVVRALHFEQVARVVTFLGRCVGHVPQDAFLVLLLVLGAVAGVVATTRSPPSYLFTECLYKFIALKSVKYNT